MNPKNRKRKFDSAPESSAPVPWENNLLINNKLGKLISFTTARYKLELGSHRMVPWFWYLDASQVIRHWCMLFQWLKNKEMMMFLFSSWTFHSFLFTKNIVFVDCIVIQTNFVTFIVITFTHELLLPIHIVPFIGLYQKWHFNKPTQSLLTHSLWFQRQKVT